MYSVTAGVNYLLSPRINKRNFTRTLKATPNNARLKAASRRTPSGERISINVSGWKFWMHESHLNDLPETLLGNIETRKLYYDIKDKDYFFDRDPHLFRYIYKYYQTGKLHFPDGECCEAFIDELAFFQIDVNELSDCCYELYAVYLDNVKERNQEQQRRQQQKDEKDEKENSPRKCFREVCWEFCEKPNSSRLAKVFYYLSCAIILFSIATNSIETISCEIKNCSTENATKHQNTTTITNSSHTPTTAPTVVSNCHIYVKCGEAHRNVFFILDAFFITYFIFEYLLRLYGTPNRMKFVASKMSIVDILAILPFFIDIALGCFDITGSKLVDMLRLFRIIRVFKLLRHSQRLKGLTSAISQSTNELGLIFFMYAVIVIVFASVIYYAEKMGSGEKQSVFLSIPEAIWYTVVTTTTLGYGDIVPETIQGKIVGSVCCLMGVLVIALPVPIIQIKSSSTRAEEEN